MAVDQVTANRKVAEALTSSNLVSDTFKYRAGGYERKLLVCGSGTFGGGTVTLSRSSAGGSEATTVDSWTAAFVEFVDPVADGDFLLTVSGGGGSEDVDITMEVGP